MCLRIDACLRSISASENVPLALAPLFAKLCSDGIPISFSPEKPFVEYFECEAI